MSPDLRRQVMSSIRRENTKPELIVRRILWRLGARFRLHGRDLPGRPDVVMRSRRTAIFVHGCLWHLHEGCRLARPPKSQPHYWPAKLARNKERDRQNLRRLREQGWLVEIIWECETRDLEALERRLRQILLASRAAIEYPFPVPGCAE